MKINLNGNFFLPRILQNKVERESLRFLGWQVFELQFVTVNGEQKPIHLQCTFYVHYTTRQSIPHSIDIPNRFDDAKKK